MTTHIHRRLQGDEFYDALRLATDSGLVLSVVQCPYLKASGLSGSEWRTRWRLSVNGEDVGSYGSLLQGFVPLAYPFATDHLTVHLDAKVVEVVLARKREFLSVSELEGRRLLDVVARLPSIFVDRPADIDWQEALCSQPGCCEDGVHLVAPKRLTAASGHYLADTDAAGLLFVRRFCDNHRRRGDSDREDSDANYTALLAEGGGA